jgi:alpha-1,2-mannosyltransferase
MASMFGKMRGYTQTLNSRLFSRYRKMRAGDLAPSYPELFRSGSYRLRPEDSLWALAWLFNLALLLWVAHRELAPHSWLGGPGKGLCDFGVYWTVGRAALHGLATVPYKEAGLVALLTQAIGPPQDPLFWMYPPPALFLVAPLGLLPYEAGYLIFMALSLALWCAAAWYLWPHPLAIALALLQFPTACNISYGQNGLLLAAGLGFVFCAAERRPVLAGSLLGVLAVKPHLAALVALPLFFARQMRAIAAAATVGSGLILASLLAFGAAPWAGFFESVRSAGPRLLDGTILAQYALTSVYMGFRSLGASASLAWAGQIASLLFALGLLTWAWLRHLPRWAQGAILALAIPLATPYVLVYDMAVCGLAALLMARESAERGGRPVFWLTVFSLGHLTIGNLVAVFTGIQVTPFLGWALVAIVIWQNHSWSRGPGRFKPAKQESTEAQTEPLIGHT